MFELMKFIKEKNIPYKFIPEGLKVEEDLDLSNTYVSSLPEGLKVNGDLDLSHARVGSLPKGLEVNGSLDLYNALITSLREYIFLISKLLFYLNN